MLGDMAIEGGNFTTAYFKQQTIRELFDMAPEEPGRREPDRDKEKEKEKERDKDRDGDVPLDEDEDPVATRRTHILEQMADLAHTKWPMGPPRWPTGTSPNGCPGDPKMADSDAKMADLADG
ncbi:PREDICTED: helicase SRCAP-like [Aptenodytes forsteri]|uniref:helicase SRCAP-like n=1 Tax=Aptenodytes forsteri TaxID=9233 RepID=UPI0004F42D81|nr:PREDICTED: helicase SRCAP-like [Aptenodytes forsteri]